jgi:hypothetical protein
LPPVEDDDLVLITEDDEIAIAGQHGEHDSGDWFGVPVLVHRRVHERGAATTSVNFGPNGQGQGRHHARQEQHLDAGTLHELKRQTLD